MGWRFWRPDKSEAERSLEALQRGASASEPATGEVYRQVGGEWDPDSVEQPAGFEMPVADVFSITGRGLVVTGQVLSGTIHQGDQVVVASLTGGSRSTVVDGVEQLRQVTETATEGDDVGLLLRGLGRDDVSVGDVIRG